MTARTEMKRAHEMASNQERPAMKRWPKRQNHAAYPEDEVSMAIRSRCGEQR
jgi:hypothetical protein